MSSIILFPILAIYALIGQSQAMCSGEAVYQVIFNNMLTPQTFGSKIPETGLNFSPLAAVSHSNRQSFLTVRGFASPQVEQIAETGMNGRFLALAENLKGAEQGVRDVAGGMGAGPGMNQTVELTVNCENPFITALSMIAPSPDWIVQVNNMNTLDMNGEFRQRLGGNLIAYDAGTDDGGDFTAASDASFDMPSEPQKNIAPLFEDETDPFDGRMVGTSCS